MENRRATVLAAIVAASTFAASIDVAKLSAAEVTVVPTTQRFIDGVSELDRRRYFNVATGSPAAFEKCPLDEGAYLFDELHVTLGRGLGLGASAVKYGKITEDPARPGYADPSSVEAYFKKHRQVAEPQLQQRLGATMDVILHDNTAPHPAFMGSALKDADHYQRIAAEPKAAAEFIALCLKFGFDDFTRPRFYEPLNEPSWQITRTPQFPALHREIAAAVRREGLDVKVGGPCSPVGYLYRDFYATTWAKSLRPFIDNAGRDVDFISFHIYDYFTGGQREILTGLPLEGAFDLYAAYTLKTLGAVKPFACSEHGATGADLDAESEPEKAATRGFKGIATPRAMCEWLHLNSLNGQVMSFIERPTMILKTVPFILDRTDAWNPRYLYALYTRAGYTKDGAFHRTAMFKFYELWKDVRGQRVEAHSDVPDVQTSAFVDGDTVFLCLKNLAGEPQNVALNVGGNARSATISRFYLKDGAPALDAKQPLAQWANIELRGDETAIVKLHYSEPVKFTAAVNERTNYAGELTVPIKANTPLVYHLTAPEKARYATLRIGLARPQTAERTPVVTFNGKEVAVPMEDAAKSRETSEEYATTKLIPIPVEALRADNEISITFPDGGGAIGSVALVAAETAKPNQP